jgi:hypothetical protein
MVLGLQGYILDGFRPAWLYIGWFKPAGLYRTYWMVLGLQGYILDGFRPAGIYIGWF